MNRLRSIHILLAAGLLASVAAFATEVPPASLRCENFTGSSTPIGYCSNGRYFCMGTTALRPLVGVSADAACHIPLADTNICNRANAQEVINSIDNQNLNKMRLWVSLAGTSPVTSGTTFSAYPFVLVPASGPTPAYWRLDRVNEVYFDKLENVVDFARGKDITLEATFFAPGEGTFPGGPWDNAKGKVCVNSSGVFQPSDTTCTLPGNTLQNAGFSDQSYFARTAADPVNGNRPRQVQKDLIKWTVDRLWCYDNVYWEIANEPEGTPSLVSAWHADLANHTATLDNARVGLTPGLTRRHRIAVNPSNTTTNYLTMANVDVVNGHYTEIYSPRGNMGAMQLIRGSGISAFNAGKLLGFNETKISALPLDNAVTLPPVFDSVLSTDVGGPDSGRAEGWEFMVNRGAAYDHWGYRHDSAVGQDVRVQMGHLRTFIAGLPLADLRRTPADGSVTHPAWLPNLQDWGFYRTGKSARIFWAALEPASTATTRVYVLYIHNSLRRCQSGTDSLSGCTSGNLPLNGYSPQIGLAKYQETLQLSLTPGKSYTVEWIRPKDRASLQAPFTLTYNADNTCTGGFSPLPCQIRSPKYDFDVVLKLTQIN
ncbi:MAG: hypothetical protein QOH06_921 [Acidobacteriota bacterium]|jgi:hypothetical protein|nr:hypothetical protein [Acidobacteriota bacterium]